MTHSTHRLPIIAGTIFLAALSASALADRQVTREGGGSFVTGGGTEGTYSRGVERGAGTMTREQSVTVGEKTYSRSATTTLDKETGEIQRTVTGPGGVTHNTSGKVEVDREAGSVDLSGTGRRGREGSVTVTPNK